VGVHATLLQSDTVHPYGRAKAGTRPLGVELRKKPKDLSAHDMRVKSVGMGRVLVCMLLCCSQIQLSIAIWSRKSEEGVSMEDVRESALCYDVVCSRKAAGHLERSTAFAILRNASTLNRYLK
jgi:hypothetical protein